MRRGSIPEMTVRRRSSRPTFFFFVTCTYPARLYFLATTSTRGVMD